MKTIKRLWEGKRINEKYKYGANWYQTQWFRICNVTRKALIVLTIVQLFMWYSVGLVTYGAVKHTQIQVVEGAEKIIEVKINETAPILERIAKCESGGVHYKNGQVIFNANTNGSVDIGKFQINSVWNKKATELGLDLTKEKDNEAFAKWIYAHRGTEDWYSSKHCWQK